MTKAIAEMKSEHSIRGENLVAVQNWFLNAYRSHSLIGQSVGACERSSLIMVSEKSSVVNTIRIDSFRYFYSITCARL